MRNANRIVAAHLLLKHRYNASLRPEYVPEPNTDTAQTRCRSSGNDQFTDSLSAAHKAGRTYCLVGGDKEKSFAASIFRQLEELQRTEDVVLYRLDHIRLHQW